MEEEFHELINGYRAGIRISTGNALFDEENFFIDAFALEAASPYSGGIRGITLLSPVPPCLYQIQEISLKRNKLPGESRAGKDKKLGISF
jgi:hypothetical protein